MDFTLFVPEMDSGAIQEGDVFARRHLERDLFGGGDHPFFGRMVPESPDTGLARVPGDFRQWRGKIVQALIVEMMWEHRRVVIQHQNGFSHRQAWRKGEVAFA